MTSLQIILKDFSVHREAAYTALGDYLKERGKELLETDPEGSEPGDPYLFFPIRQWDKPPFSGTGAQGVLETMLNALPLDSSGRREGVNHQNDNGDTLLHLAVRLGDNRAVSVILQAGANPNLSDWQGRTALHELAENPSLLVLQAFQKTQHPLNLAMEDALNHSVRAYIEGSALGFQADFWSHQSHREMLEAMALSLRPALPGRSPGP